MCLLAQLSEELLRRRVRLTDDYQRKVVINAVFHIGVPYMDDESRRTMQHQNRLCEVLGIEQFVAAQPGGELWSMVEHALVALLPLPSSVHLEAIGCLWWSTWRSCMQVCGLNRNGMQQATLRFV